MAVWFVSRHQGAIDWAKAVGFSIDHWCEHLTLGSLTPGDIVVGTLPVPMVAEICAIGATYWHLSIDLPRDLRGVELSADQLRTLGVHLRPFAVQALTPIRGDPEGL